NISQTMENKFRQILGLIKIASENDGYKIKKSPPKSVPKLPTNRVINNTHFGHSRSIVGIIIINDFSQFTVSNI
ncbi:hypothetical protein, partial [Schinkia azotoformans]|uniref:hypothetical protein n=1 Tax=Schinkia azotoformans TaxID=1454 RepID=UPI002E1D24F2|nr:hypothetical protein [Schinkia azotoformans]